MLHERIQWIGNFSRNIGNTAIDGLIAAMSLVSPESAKAADIDMIQQKLDEAAGFKVDAGNDMTSLEAYIRDLNSDRALLQAELRRLQPLHDGETDATQKATYLKQGQQANNLLAKIDENIERSNARLDQLKEWFETASKALDDAGETLVNIKQAIAEAETAAKIADNDAELAQRDRERQDQLGNLTNSTSRLTGYLATLKAQTAAKQREANVNREAAGAVSRAQGGDGDLLEKLREEAKGNTASADPFESVRPAAAAAE